MTSMRQIDTPEDLIAKPDLDSRYSSVRSPDVFDGSVFAPKPTHLDDTGVSKWLLADLACKHLEGSGVLDLGELAQRLGLPGMVVEELLHFLREEGRVELRSRRDTSPLLRFGLTEKGRTTALDALQKDGYVGPAPVPLDRYEHLVAAQSVRRSPLTKEQVREIFADTVIRPELLDRLGPAAHSGRAIFIYGQPGTGKSFMARRLHRTLDSTVLLPFALAIGDSVVPYFDGSLHKPVSVPGEHHATLLNQGFDARYIRCERPMVVIGGELTMDLLELQFETSARRYAAPLQLKANCGLLVIDDLGRQQINPETLLNRWILPMEERRDQLSLKSGQHFSVPFDLTLVFSTNMEPRDLADEAFLRRIGYKVRFEEASREEYTAIWQQVCEQMRIVFDRDLFLFVLEELHAREGVPLMQCYPRDLLQLAADYMSYASVKNMDRETLTWAWRNYFLEI